MSAPTAMCSIETVAGREYKVKDMAMADFGYVVRLSHDWRIRGKNEDPRDRESVAPGRRWSRVGTRLASRDPCPRLVAAGS